MDVIVLQNKKDWRIDENLKRHDICNIIQLLDIMILCTGLGAGPATVLGTIGDVFSF